MSFHIIFHCCCNIFRLFFGLTRSQTLEKCCTSSNHLSNVSFASLAIVADCQKFGSFFSLDGFSNEARMKEEKKRYSLRDSATAQLLPVSFVSYQQSFIKYTFFSRNWLSVSMAFATEQKINCFFFVRSATTNRRVAHKMIVQLMHYVFNYANCMRFSAQSLNQIENYDFPSHSRRCGEKLFNIVNGL